MNQSAIPRLINAVAVNRWYDPATDTVHLSDGLEGCEPRTLPGFDGPRALMLEEHRLWGWDTVEPSRLSRPGWLGWYINRLRDQVLRELESEGRPLVIIPDLEAIRLNDPNRRVHAERIIYTREILAAVRDVAGPASKVVPYDIPYQDGAGGAEEYLDMLMPTILPHLDAIGCLMYLRKPGQTGVPEFFRQHLARCRKWSAGKPLEAIVWDSYVEDETTEMASGHWADTWYALRSEGITTTYLWDSLKSRKDYDRIAARVGPIKTMMRRAWAQPVGEPA